jgi:hypothetical protein
MVCTSIQRSPGQQECKEAACLGGFEDVFKPLASTIPLNETDDLQVLD